MTRDEAIKEALRTFATTAPATLTGTIKAVDETNATATVDIGNGLLLEDVRLRATIDGNKGFYLIPAIDSSAFLLRIESSDEFLAVGFSTVDKVVFKGENTGLTITNDQIIFNNNELESYGIDINSLRDKLNTIEQHINDLKTVLSNWVPVPQDGGYSLKAASAVWAGQTITETTVDYLKDPKILN